MLLVLKTVHTSHEDHCPHMSTTSRQEHGDEDTRRACEGFSFLEES